MEVPSRSGERSHLLSLLDQIHCTPQDNLNVRGPVGTRPPRLRHGVSSCSSDNWRKHCEQENTSKVRAPGTLLEVAQTILPKDRGHACLRPASPVSSCMAVSLRTQRKTGRASALWSRPPVHHWSISAVPGWRWDPQPWCIRTTLLPTQPPSRGSVYSFIQQSFDVQSTVWVDRQKTPHSSLKSRGVTKGHLNSAPRIKQDVPAIPEVGTNALLYLQEFNHFLHYSCSQRLLHSLQRGREGAAQHPSGSLREQKQGNSEFFSDVQKTFQSYRGRGKNNP